jgi:hypothetical protein
MAYAATAAAADVLGEHRGGAKSQGGHAATKREYHLAGGRGF